MVSDGMRTYSGDMRAYRHPTKCWALEFFTHDFTFILLFFMENWLWIAAKMPHFHVTGRMSWSQLTWKKMLWRVQGTWHEGDALYVSSESTCVFFAAELNIYFCLYSVCMGISILYPFMHSKNFSARVLNKWSLFFIIPSFCMCFCQKLLTYYSTWACWRVNYVVFNLELIILAGICGGLHLPMHKVPPIWFLLCRPIKWELCGYVHRKASFQVEPVHEIREARRLWVSHQV